MARRFVPLTRRREDALLSAIAFADREVRTVDRDLVDLAAVRRELRRALRAVEHEIRDLPRRARAGS
jgi:hypothetical protein